MTRAIGTCSLCGGIVTIVACERTGLMGRPSCANCHAVPLDTRPVIRMRPAPEASRQLVDGTSWQ